MKAAAWGDNSTGQLGAGFRSGQMRTPVGCRALGEADQFATSYGSAYAVKNGQLYVVGENIYGQYGDGTKTTARTNAGSPLSGVSAIAPGGAHWTALCEDGSIVTCGGNSFGTLGNGTPGSLGKETGGSPVPIHLTGLPAFSAVDSGGGNCVALTPDGRVFSWGEGKRGENGDGTKEERNVPTEVPGLTGIKQISVGGVGGEGAHTLALCDNGTVLAWGNNNHGQLGIGDTTNRLVPTPIGILGAIAVSSGPSHSLVLLAGGTVLGFGSNAVGMLGFEPLTSVVSVPTPIVLPDSVTAIAAGFRFSLFLIGGKVYTCGWNQHGTLGYPTEAEYVAEPKDIGLSGVETICASDFEAIVGTTQSLPVPITATGVVGGIELNWLPGMAKRVVSRPIERGHQEWENRTLVEGTSYTVPLSPGSYEVAVTGGLLGQLVVEGVAL